MTTRLLFDQNMPRRLVTRLEDIFPDASHVYLIGLSQATDVEIWKFAFENDYAIATKDSDFNNLSMLRGEPPKVIWLRIGNASAKECEIIIRKHHQAILNFLGSSNTRLLSIARG